MQRNRLLLIIVFFVLKANMSTALCQDSPGLVILHTNDMHSRLEGYAPTSNYTPLVTGNDITVGGFSRIATILKNEKSRSPSSTLIVDAGDFLMGTFFHYMEEYDPFQMALMKEMGYDFLALGNHEFDYGPRRLAAIINNSARDGDIPQLLLGNAVFDKKQESDDDLEKLLKEGVIKRSTIIEKNGIRIGLFSLMGSDADESAPYAAPVTFDKVTRSSRKIVKDLKNQGCDIIICLSHSGLETTGPDEWGGEDVKLAEKIDDIDIIISSHTHTRLEEPLLINNTLIVQTESYGHYVGRLEIVLSGGQAKLVDYKLIPVNDQVKGDPYVRAQILGQKSITSDKLFEVTGYRLDDKVVETVFELECDEYGGLSESNLGPLAADAVYEYVNEKSAAGADIGMVAAGVIRDGIKPGVQSVQDIFRVMSLGSGDDEVPGYPLARVYVNAKELKRIIEILLVAYKSSPSNYCYYSGLEVKYNPGKGLLRKIESISIKNEQGKLIPVDISRNNENLYSITANSYMLEFIGIIQKMTFGLIRVKPKDIKGIEIPDIKSAIIDFDTTGDSLQEGKEWIALVEYLMSMKDADNDGISDIEKRYAEPSLCLVPVE
ncbi:MAG: bifunctional metallophosphatase/5'-nucleotidase [Bacteroidales bacterium]|nr:bifunctional metallophosphatase/5'-nucleotidase [Bacteroidales bacterium]